MHDLRRILKSCRYGPVPSDILMLYALTFFIILPLLCRNLRHSFYFVGWKNQDEGMRQLLEENDIRTTQATHYLQTIAQLQHSNLTDTIKRDLLADRVPMQVAIIVITQSRTRYLPAGINPLYLTQTAAKIHQQIEMHNEMNRNSPKTEFYLLVCNVDPDPDFHKEIPAISQSMAVVNRFKHRELPMVHPKEKEKQDYQFCLNHSLSLKTDYVFLVEDDAFPTPDALTVVSHVLSRMQHVFHPVSYIKFYHPERLLTFLSMSPERLPELVAFTAVSSTIFTLLYTNLTQARGLHTISTIQLSTWLLFVLYFVLVALSVGRANISELRRFLSPYFYSVTPAPSCCTQAIIYPSASAARLLKALNSSTCDNNHAKDHVLEQFSRQWEGSRAYLVQPSTFNHIGLYSALRNQIVDPFLL